MVELAVFSYFREQVSREVKVTGLTRSVSGTDVPLV